MFVYIITQLSHCVENIQMYKYLEYNFNNVTQLTGVEENVQKIYIFEENIIMR